MRREAVTGPAAPAIPQDRRHFLAPALRVAVLARFHRSSRFAGETAKKAKLINTEFNERFQSVALPPGTCFHRHVPTAKGRAPTKINTDPKPGSQTVPDVDRGAEEASAMNDYEILRVIDFIERTREPFAKLMPVSDEEHRSGRSSLV